jgi:RNA polymerase sigma-70 factor (ECF subfamily)
MSPVSSSSTDETRDAARERRLLDCARRGDEDAYRGLLEPHSAELHAHCYRMLGSVHDADDALQDASLRAWRALARFEGRGSLRSWLYTIATNTCLTQIQGRPRRVLPIDHGPRTDPHAGPGEPLVESVWVEPYPDAELDLGDGLAGPDAHYELRESVELAFIVALQHLPATQRAVLILREVLGFSAKEVAETLDTTVASVNSALQRARASLDDRLPDRSQQATLRALGDDALRDLVSTYVEAWERNDVETVVTLLAEEATFAMPPLASWFGPRDEIAVFLAEFPLSGAWRWRTLLTTANGQPAIGFYAWDQDARGHLAFALNVLTLRGSQIVDVVAFVARATEAPERAAYARWVDQPADAARLQSVFGRFGLPERLA